MEGQFRILICCIVRPPISLERLRWQKITNSAADKTAAAHCMTCPKQTISPHRQLLERRMQCMYRGLRRKDLGDLDMGILNLSTTPSAHINRLAPSWPP